MSGRRKSGSHSESFNVRWHSVVNTATPSVDIMSSPDPLNDTPVSNILFSGEKRITRSQRSDRFMSLGTSPRKQTFALQVGDNKSPQRLFVTVSTEDGSPIDGPRRKLFNSQDNSTMLLPVERTTTTTIPLRDISEEEGEETTTPRRRGRPRKSNGTPIPSAAKKRRAGTPIKRTPRPIRVASAENSDGDDSEPAAMPTPTPKRRARQAPEASPAPTPASKRRERITADSVSVPTAETTPKRRGRPPKTSVVEPSSDAGFGSVTASTKRGRRRRQALAPDELIGLADKAASISTIVESASRSEDEMELVPSEAPASAIANRIAPRPSEPDSDIWMTTFSNEATPKASAHTTKPLSASSPSTSLRDALEPQLQPQPQPQPQPELQSEDAPETWEDDGYEYLAPPASDLSSADDPLDDAAPRMDTIAQGEDFSMIFMDSIPSFQDFKSSVPAAAYEEFGEETNHIINTTLESFRQSAARSPRAEVDAEAENSRYSIRLSEPIGGSPDELFADDVEEQEANLIQELADDHAVEEEYQGQYVYEGVEKRQHEDNAEPDAEAVDVPLDKHASGPIAESVEATMEDAATNSPQHAVDQLADQEPLYTRPPTSVRQAVIRALGRTPRLSRSPRKSIASSPLRHRVLLREAQQVEESAFHDSEIITDEATLDADSRDRLSARVNDEDSNLYEDSFSEIPENVLEAATPRRPNVTMPYEDEEYDMNDEMANDDDNQQEAIELEREQQEPVEAGQDIMDMGQPLDLGQPQDEEQDMESHYREEQPAPSDASGAARSDGSRLPTPDDTPPQREAGLIEDTEKSSQPPSVASPRALYANRSSAEQQHVADAGAGLSQPLGPPTIIVEPSAPTIEATPVHQMSSPLQEPLSLLHEPVHERTSRLALSPIVRAGRVLQSVTSDPPSPGDRQRQLGSPFRRSESRDSWAGSKDGHNSRLISKSPPMALLAQQAQIRARSLSHDDPFDSTSKGIGQGSLMEALETSAKAQQDRPLSRESDASSVRVTPPSDSGFSWVEREGPISPRLRGDNSLLEASGMSNTQAATQSSSMPQLDGATNDGEDVDELQQPRDDETDIWEIEALRETPRPPRQQSFGKRTGASPRRPGRRGALPSPWTKKTTQPPTAAADVAPQPVEQPPSPVRQTVPTAPQSERVEEYSLLVETQPSQGPQPEPRSEAQQEPRGQPESSSKASRFDLSSFFSSPAAIPGMLASTFLPAKTKSLWASKTTPQGATEAAGTIQTSSMFPQIPQKEFQPATSSAKNLFSPVRSTGTDADQAGLAQSSPDTPEHIELPVVAQKQNFTPRPRQASRTFFQPSSARSAAVTPPRMQLSHADIHRWQQQTSHADGNSPDLAGRLLRPLPPKNASPTKSSLRSPLKPHTPGRVVEFTSSVLSPVEQAKARHERRLSSSVASQGRAPVPIVAPVPETNNKENEMEASTAEVEADVSMSDAPPLPDKSHQPARLSQSVWARPHWLFLDELIQLRRKGPFEADYQRRTDKYLGKTVKSQGEAMKLERWHLDCVDAFKSEVGGWDEGVLAKRLFALLLGEDRRSRGLYESPARANMFH